MIGDGYAMGVAAEIAHSTTQIAVRIIGAFMICPQQGMSEKTIRILARGHCSWLFWGNIFSLAFRIAG